MYQIELGFTGTRKGMTLAQIDKLSSVLTNLMTKVSTAHHGCCIGADAQFHWLLRKIDYHIPIVAHRCNVLGQQDVPVILDCDVIEDPFPPLKRNKNIVDQSNLIIACPNGVQELIRSGTWATVRYAKKRAKDLIIIFPDGSQDS